jgi:hypothetical protein
MVAIINTLFTILTGVLVASALPSDGWIDLKSAGSFGALSASGITNTGATVITGNLGTTSTSVTGFPPGKVTGDVDINTGPGNVAYTDSRNAFAYGQSLVATVNKAGKTTLDGENFSAGIYNYDGGVGLTGSCTFNAGGDPTSVWVMKIAATLTTGSASNVVLAGGAKASNIFWVVGSSATLGTYSTLQGSVLAAAGITAETGSTVNGGLYAGSLVAFQDTAVTVNATAATHFRRRRSTAFRA